jgi:acyl-coenzyme A synthetase/AMP-(fatty) acid ligase
MEDCKAKVLITASGVMRGNKKIDLKAIADSAHAICAKAGHVVPSVLVYENTRAAPKGSVAFAEGRDIWYADAVANQPKTCEVEWVESEHPLFLLYTSGSTGVASKLKQLAHNVLCMGGKHCTEVLNQQGCWKVAGLREDCWAELCCEVCYVNHVVQCCLHCRWHV